MFSKLNRAEKYLNSVWGELNHTVMPLKPTLCNQSWAIPEKEIHRLCWCWRNATLNPAFQHGPLNVAQIQELTSYSTCACTHLSNTNVHFSIIIMTLSTSNLDKHEIKIDPCITCIFSILHVLCLYCSWFISACYSRGEKNLCNSKMAFSWHHLGLVEYWLMLIISWEAIILGHCYK